MFKIYVYLHTLKSFWCIINVIFSLIPEIMEHDFVSVDILFS